MLKSVKGLVYRTIGKIVHPLGPFSELLESKTRGAHATDNGGCGEIPSKCWQDLVEIFCIDASLGVCFALSSLSKDSARRFVRAGLSSCVFRYKA